MPLEFLERLNSAAGSLVNAAWIHFLQLTVLTALLALVDATVGRRLGSHWRCALWLIFFAKLALPPHLALPSSPLYWWSGDATPAASAPVVITPAMSAPSGAEPNWAAASTTVSDGERVALPSATAPLSWQLLAVAGWLAGAGALAAGTLVRRAQLRRLLRTGAAPPNELQDAFGRACTQTGVRRPVALRIVDADICPLVSGLLHPTIYLPRTLTERLTPAQQYAVLIHELSHVTRGDLWVAAVQMVARVLFFYHPAVWWVNRHLNRLREEATDRAVLFHPDVDPRSYSLALVEAAAVVMAGGRFSSRFALGVIETKSQLRKRIAMNLHQPRSRRVRLGPSGLLSLAVLGLLLIPMAPAESGMSSSAAPFGFKATEPEPLVTRIDSATTAIITAFNRRDRDAYVDRFTADTLILPNRAPLVSGRNGAAQMYLQVPTALQYEPMQWSERQVYQLDRWIIETGLVDFRVRLMPEAPILHDPRQAFTIWEQGDDGILRVKVLAWNGLAQPEALQRQRAPQAFVLARPGGAFGVGGDFAPVLAAEERFHRAFEEQQLEDAVRFYAKDAILLSPDVPLLRGQAAILSYLQALPPGRMVKAIERQTAHVEGNQDTVLVVNLFRWTFAPADTDVLIPITGKGVHVWQRDSDGTWRILFDLPNVSQSTAG